MAIGDLTLLRRLLSKMCERGDPGHGPKPLHRKIAGGPQHTHGLLSHSFQCDAFFRELDAHRASVRFDPNPRAERKNLLNILRRRAAWEAVAKILVAWAVTARRSGCEALALTQNETVSSATF
jgi:hypothetical protein